MTTPNGDTYPTADTSLAAWLYSQGYQIIETKRDKVPLKLGGKPTIFVFEKSESILEHIRQWQVGEAVGNCYQYEQSFRALINLINAPRNNE